MENADQNLNNIDLIRQNLADLERLKLERFGFDFSESEKLKLIHELEVHQIELELQNEELLLAKQQADSAIEKYTELYDFSPSGYFTLSREGIIIDANLTGSTMLGVDRINLIQAKFRSFLCNDSKMEFDIFFDKIFINKIRECCEICLESKVNTHYAYLSGIITEDEQFCLVTVVDITDLNLMKNALQNSEERYRDLLYNLDMGIVVHNLETSIVMSNPKASELLGITSEEMKYRSIYNHQWLFFDENDIPLAVDDYPVNIILRTGQPLKNFRGKVFRTETNDSRLLLINGFPLKKFNGEL